LFSADWVDFYQGEEMKRLVLAAAVIGFVACKRAETPPPPADTAMPPAAAPAPADSAKMMDTTKMMSDTAKGE
jgi:hypothetical protein